MKLEILSFGGNLFESNEVISVTAATKVGEVTILKDHTSLVTSLTPSVVEIKYIENGEEKEKDFAIGGGILEVYDNKVKVLIDMLVTVEDVDVDHAEKARKEAEKLMEKYKDSKDKIDMEKFIQAEDMLLKSIAQLKLKK